MFLDTLRIMAAKNGKQLIIRDEEKSREGISFRIQVIIQTLLAFFQTSDQHLKLLQTAGSVTGFQNLGILSCIVHDLTK